MTSDFAVTEDKGDFTEHGVFGTDENDNLFILGWWFGQKTADIWIDALCDLILAWKPHCWFGESGPIRRSVEPFLTKRIRERQAYCRVEWIPSTADKPTRARSFQARASMGKVFLPREKDWSQRLLSQLLAFPAGKYDDAVDVCSLMGQVIDQSHPAVIPQAKETRNEFARRIDGLKKGVDYYPPNSKRVRQDPWDIALYGDRNEGGVINTVD
jgi:predicted phage terminase large subunit-like protein